ncbi:MAG TPA: choice-of-anchor tandem repeat GloVer-containing protein [Terriglobales bacterium]|nr:choice-of-anchor tandem repeat GloVer-containing protein [Terriglobales bacterium]
MRGLLILTLLPALLLAALSPALAQTETVLYSFVNVPDGAIPYAVTPVLDKNGNLYGTTMRGGAYGYGTVFEVTPTGTETVLHSFNNDGTDGIYPYNGLVLGKKGNLYGITTGGGAYGYGMVFALTPSGKGTILHSFQWNGIDGFGPFGGLVKDKKGNLYGTTSYGGAHGDGTVFELTTLGTETILYSFDANGTDGYNPDSTLILDAAGNIYGTTGNGGLYGYGTVFKLTPSGIETILHSFGASGDGYYPSAGMVLDKKGNLYGTTGTGGAYGYGTVFELDSTGTETILHNFNADGTDGTDPQAGLVLGKKGVLYGTTVSGGAFCSPSGCGTVFELTRTGKESILHSFGAAGDGYYPYGGLVLDKQGNAYGTTYAGGYSTGECAYFGGCGMVFKVTP